MVEKAGAKKLKKSSGSVETKKWKERAQGGVSPSEHNSTIEKKVAQPGWGGEDGKKKAGGKKGQWKNRAGEESGRWNAL